MVTRSCQLLAAVTLMVVFVWLRLDWGITNWADQAYFANFWSGIYLFFAGCCVSSVGSIIGCCALINLSHSTLIVDQLCGLTSLILQLVGLTCILTDTIGKPRQWIQDLLLALIDPTQTNNVVAAENFLDNLYRIVGCCGAHGSDDYLMYGRTPPNSCIDRYHAGGIYYKEGCGEGFSFYLKQWSIGLGVVVLLTLVTQICCGILFYHLIRRIKAKRKGKNPQPTGSTVNYDYKPLPAEPFQTSAHAGNNHRSSSEPVIYDTPAIDSNQDQQIGTRVHSQANTETIQTNILNSRAVLQTNQAHIQSSQTNLQTNLQTNHWNQNLARNINKTRLQDSTGANWNVPSVIRSGSTNQKQGYQGFTHLAPTFRDSDYSASESGRMDSRIEDRGGRGGESDRATVFRFGHQVYEPGSNLSDSLGSSSQHNQSEFEIESDDLRPQIGKKQPWSDKFGYQSEISNLIQSYHDLRGLDQQEDHSSDQFSDKDRSESSVLEDFSTEYEYSGHIKKNVTFTPELARRAHGSENNNKKQFRTAAKRNESFKTAVRTNNIQISNSIIRELSRSLESVHEGFRSLSRVNSTHSSQRSLGSRSGSLNSLSSSGSAGRNFTRSQDVLNARPIRSGRSTSTSRLGPEVRSRSVTGIHVLARGLKPRKQKSGKTGRGKSPSKDRKLPTRRLEDGAYTQEHTATVNHHRRNQEHTATVNHHRRRSIESGIESEEGDRSYDGRAQKQTSKPFFQNYSKRK